MKLSYIYRWLYISGLGCMLFMVICVLLHPIRYSSLVHPRDEWILLDPFIVDPHGLALQEQRLPDLKKIGWPKVQIAPQPSGLRFPNGTPYQLPKAFDPVMSRGQRELFINLLQIFSNLMMEHGYFDRFMLYGGTLIGSYRHHDFIPWDDDIDLLVDEKVRPTIHKLLQQMEPDYRLHIQMNRDKFFRRFPDEKEYDKDVPYSRNSSIYSWGWPYIDIGYYRLNSTHMCEIAESYGRTYCWRTKLVFPLIYRPFGHFWLPAPFDTETCLKETYDNLWNCVVHGYSHVLEGGGPSGTTLCQNLNKRYAFVKRKFSRHRIYAKKYPVLAEKLTAVDEVLVTYPDIANAKLFHLITLPSVERDFV